MIDTNGDGIFETASWSLGKDLDHDHIPDWTEMLNAFRAAGWQAGADWPKGKKEWPHVQKTFRIKLVSIKCFEIS
jgi:hypothetical protein